MSPMETDLTNMNPANNEPLTVTELTARIKQVLEQGFAIVQVTGEISRMTTPSSGHLYFTIKDAHASISAVVWRSTVLRLSSRPKEGQAYIFVGHLSLYEPRGTYQLVIQRIEAVGAGKLAAEYEARKQKIANLGWFDSEKKLRIPKLPKHIGIVTSSTAAAFSDVQKVLATRPSWLTISLSPCLVQGEQAAETVVTAIQRLHQLENKPDVILLVRGGGSMEDLWCFNDERMVKSIFEATIPIISGIGHEIDTTLSDLAADVRAATPSNAAEICCPSRETLRQQIPQLQSLASLLSRRIQQSKQQLHHLKQQQAQRIHSYQDKQNWALERLNSKIEQSYNQNIQILKKVVRVQRETLQSFEPNQRLRQDTQRYLAAKQRLSSAVQTRHPILRRHLEQQCNLLLANHQKQLTKGRQQWQRLHEQLFAMNPLHVLKRGYAMTTNKKNQIISSIGQVQAGDVLKLYFHDGRAQTNVVKTSADKESKY